MRLNDFDPASIKVKFQYLGKAFPNGSLHNVNQSALSMVPNNARCFFRKVSIF